jgi:toxin ParE1/3/4
MAEYRLTPAAEHDLETIWSHTRQQWGIEQANRYIDNPDGGFCRVGAITQYSPSM